MDRKQDAKPQVIGIRADANEEIASGHVMRCIAIAGQLIRLGSRVIFFTADECADELLDRAGMPHICLHTDWMRMEDETETLLRELRKAGCRKLLVDSYQATEDYFRALAGQCRLICMDDCFEGVYPAEMVVNYNPYCTRFPYAKAYGDGVRLLLGPAYTPLREEFAAACGDGAERVKEAAREQREDIPAAGAEMRVLLSAGGGDTCDALSGILQAALADDALRGLTYEVVVGRYNENRDKLERLAAAHDNVRLHCQADNMAELMKGCIAAVSAAGTTLLELCAMRIPTVFFVVADNQRYDSDFFAREGRMFFAGDIRGDRGQCLRDICGGLRKLMESGPLRAEMRQKLGEVTDGRGARRIAGEILNL